MKTQSLDLTGISRERIREFGVKRSLIHLNDPAGKIVSALTQQQDHVRSRAYSVVLSLVDAAKDNNVNQLIETLAQYSGIETDEINKMLNLVRVDLEKIIPPEKKTSDEVIVEMVMRDWKEAGGARSLSVRLIESLIFEIKEEGNNKLTIVYICNLLEELGPICEQAKNNMTIFFVINVEDQNIPLTKRVVAAFLQTIKNSVGSRFNIEEAKKSLSAFTKTARSFSTDLVSTRAAVD